jgi:hypothetical protein
MELQIRRFFFFFFFFVTKASDLSGEPIDVGQVPSESSGGDCAGFTVHHDVVDVARFTDANSNSYL